MKQPNALSRDASFLATGALEVASSSQATLAFVAQLQRYLKVTQVFVRGELLSGGAVIHTASSSLLRRARASIAQGAIEVYDNSVYDQHPRLVRLYEGPRIVRDELPTPAWLFTALGTR